jgi:hypothetical protein
LAGDWHMPKEAMDEGLTSVITPAGDVALS